MKRSAFGVEHVTKAVGQEYRDVLDARRARSVLRRPVPAPHFNPSDEQKAATAARRGAQAQTKANKQFVRVGGKPSSWRSHIKAGPAANLAISGGLATGAGYALHRDRQVAKSDHSGRDAALGAVVGAGSADAALTVGGQAAKAHLKRQREKVGTSPHDEKVWAEHKSAFGVSGRTTSSTPGAVKNAMHAKYPKSLPGWRLQRALAVKNRPAVTGGIVATAALGGALAAHRHSQVAKAGVVQVLADKENLVRNAARITAGGVTGDALRRNRRAVKKSDDTRRHVEEGAATVGGAGLGQGAYQQAGYATKHHVDRLTRKHHGRVSPEQVRLQDKVLKPAKKKYGMYLPKGHPDRDNTAYHRNYPTTLPHGRTIRVLGHTHEGRLGVAVGTAVTAASAAGSLGLTHHFTKPKGKTMAKSAFGVEHVTKGLTNGDIAREVLAGRKPRLIGRKRDAAERTRAKAVLANPKLSQSEDDYWLTKAYRPGTITIHNEDARMHGRKKNSGYRQAAAGTVIGTGGVALHQNARPAARFLAEHATTEGPAHKVKVARALVPKLERVGVGAAIGGGALLGVGAVRAFHHGRKQNQSAKKAQAARRERNIELEERSMAKSAFGVEIGKGTKTRKGAAVQGAAVGAGTTYALNAGAVHYAAHRGAMAHPGAYKRASTAKKVGMHARMQGQVARDVVRRPREALETLGGGAVIGAVAGAVAHNKRQATDSLGKSAFGVEIGKLGPPKVHYREVTATRTKGNIASTYLPDSVETGYRGKSLILRRKKYDALGGPSNWTPRSGDLVARSPRYRVHHADARRLAHAHEKNTDTVELASGATLKHRNEVKKSAFLDEPVEKFALGAVLDAGRDALKGLQHGAAGKSFGSAPGATAGALGAKSGNVLRTNGLKLKPLVNTPAKAGLAAGGAGLTGGALLGRKSNN